MPEPLVHATGFAPYDLAAPLKTLDPSKARCLVCGKPSPIEPLRNIFRVGSLPARDGHEACRATLSDWHRQVDLIAQDAEYAAAVVAVDDAWQTANSMWHEKVDALDGISESFKRALDSPLEGRCDC